MAHSGQKSSPSLVENKFCILAYRKVVPFDCFQLESTSRKLQGSPGLKVYVCVAGLTKMCNDIVLQVSSSPSNLIGCCLWKQETGSMRMGTAHPGPFE